MNNQLVTLTQNDPVALENTITALVTMTTAGLNSDNSRRAYAAAVTEFVTWAVDNGATEFSRALVQSYRRELQDRVSPSTLNVKLSAIRRMVRELADNDQMDPHKAGAITDVKGITSAGTRIGNWLTKQQADALLSAPDTQQLKGKRDRALLAVLLGAALRREEAANLTVEHIQQREARWVIVDLVGKRGKVRSIPLPSGVKAALDRWTAAAGITTGPIFLALRRGDSFYLADGKRKGMTPGAIWDVVKTYAAAVGVDELAPHDLRRTAAKLMQAGGAELTQISMILGHSSLDVTKRYLGTELELHNAATDRIDLAF